MKWKALETKELRRFKDGRDVFGTNRAFRADVRRDQRA